MAHDIPHLDNNNMNRLIFCCCFVAFLCTNPFVYPCLLKRFNKHISRRVLDGSISLPVTSCTPYNPTSCLKRWETEQDVPVEWLTYLNSVYGSKGVTYPFDPKLLKFFYADRVPFKDSAIVVKYKNLNSVKFGQLFECGWLGNPNMWCIHAFGSGIGNNKLNTAKYDTASPYGQPSHGFFFVPGASSDRWLVWPAFQEGQRVEVSHQCCDSYEGSEGMWFFHAPGTGVYLQVGKVLNFRSKIELCHYITKTTKTHFNCNICCDPLHRYLIPHLRRLGIETVVITDSVPGGYVSSIEIWDVRETKPQKEPLPCAPVHEDSLTCKDCTARFLFRSYKGTEPCICDKSTRYMLQCVEPDIPEKLTVVFTGDMHGYIDGVPKLLDFISQRRQKVKNVILLSTGDAFLGSRFFRENGPVALGKKYMPLQYDVMGLGNHDLEFYKDLSAFATAAGSSLVCFNLHNLAGVARWVHILTTPLKACATGFTVLDNGIVDQKALKYAKPNSTLFWEELHDVLHEMQHEGCKIIFILGHGGLKLDIEISQAAHSIVSNSSVVVLGGHDHDIYFQENYQNPDHIVMHAGALFLQAGLLELNLVTDQKSGQKKIIEAHGKMLPLIDEASRLVSSDEPMLFELLWTQDSLQRIHSQDCRSGRCPLGDMVAEFMFLAASCERDAPGIVIGALREAGSIRSALGHRVTKSDLRNVLLWNNDLLVVEVTGQQISSMLHRSYESIEHDGGGASLSLFGVKVLNNDQDQIMVLTDSSAQDHCDWWYKNMHQKAHPVVSLGHQQRNAAPLKRFRRLEQNETILITVTSWLWQGGDDFVTPNLPPINVVGPEIDVIVAMFPTSVSTSGTGIFGVALGAISKGLISALVYGCSRSQTHDIVFRNGQNLQGLNLKRIMPCKCRGGCLITTIAIIVGHFIFWSIFRICLSFGIGTVLASVIAAVFVAIVENPLWVIVTRIQSAEYETESSGYELVSLKEEDESTSLAEENNDSLDQTVNNTLAEDKTVLNQTPQPPTNCITQDFWSCLGFASIMLRTKGIAGFYTGLSSNLALTTHPIIQANLYLAFVHVLSSYKFQNSSNVQEVDDSLGSDPWISIVAGFVSTGITTLVTYPLQVIRIRLQMDQPVFTGGYYDGFLMKAVQSVFNATVSFFVMDYVAFHLQSFTLRKFLSFLNLSLGD